MQQLPLSPDPLVVVGTGAVVVGVVMLLVLGLRRLKRSDGTPEPTVADWIGEAATGPALPTGPSPATPDEATTRVDSIPTGADHAVTASTSGHSPDVAAAAVHLEPGSRTGDDAPPDPAASPAPWQVAGTTGAVPVPPRDPLGHATARDQSGSARTVAAAVARAFAVRAAASRGGLGPARGPTAEAPPAATDIGGTEGPAASASDEAPQGGGTEGDPAEVDAPAHARPGPAADGAEAHAPVPHPRPDGETGHPAPPSEPPPTRPTHADARDRLLAVLLDDPSRAVDATEELAACLDRLAQLSDAMRREHAALRDALHRLAAAGLRPDQLARLAGMPLSEVLEILAPAG